MDIIKASINITKTIRNVGRLREIVLTFGKHGFNEFISRGVTSNIPDVVLPKAKRSIKEEMSTKSEVDWHQIIGSRLRRCFESLGPAFVKFGQLLSSREDIFDKSFIDEMKLLRDQVKPMSLEELRPEIEKSLGKKIEDVFETIDAKPIGMASIGIVFKGVLKTGEKVVIKVKRPNINKIIETDFSIMLFLTEQAEKVSDEIKFLGLSRIVRDFGVSLQNELNFNVEALNCERLKKNIKVHDTNDSIYIPEVYKDYTSENVLIMEFMEGIPFSAPGIIDHKDKIVSKLNDGVEIFAKTFLVDGFFHADLHGGNFFLLPDGRLGIIDFGLMGTLGKKSRKNFIAIIYSLITYNYENLVYEFLDVAEYDKTPDVDNLINDVRETLSPYVGLTVSQTNYSLVLQDVIENLRKHQIYLPREWFIVFRALITLDGVGKSLEFDIDIFSLMENDIEDLIKSALSKEELLEEAVWGGRDILSTGRLLPRYLKWFLKDFAKKGYAFELTHRGIDKLGLGMINSVLFLGHSLLCGVFVASGVVIVSSTVVTHWTDIPILSWVFWFFACIAMLKAQKELNAIKSRNK